MALLDYWDRYKVHLSIAAGVIAAIIVAVWLWNVFSGEERRIRKFVQQGKKAVEAGNILSCAELVSADYQDKYGNDRQGIIFCTKEAFNYYKKIQVNIKEMEIKLDEAKVLASVEIKAEVIGLRDACVPENIMEADKDYIRLKVVKKEKKWRLLELEFFGRVNIMGQNFNQGHE